MELYLHAYVCLYGIYFMSSVPYTLHAYRYRPCTLNVHMINTKTSHFRCSSITVLSFVADAYNDTVIVALISVHINYCNYTGFIITLFVVFILCLEALRTQVNDLVFM